ncbi:MAG: electron transport complex subunit E [Bacilli bacterium]|jgi:electron transport complex protein RnfE|nr:electron transport complex subunit E [Bacilli bacterium]MCH4210261.1 electron transport complex subunit E [Bacilli bacterium]MCH4277439.1 electron transport complex subunit E [Bacilli bacterium]MCI2054659.1 electron transport complex subunit E [Bacilli bacterium]
MDSIAKARHKESFVAGIIKENPLFVAILGTCPALAVTTSLEVSIGMGLLLTFVLVCSNVLISLLRKVIPEEIETPAYIVIIATFVTIVKMMTQAFLPELYSSLGVFLSLVVVNCIVLGRAEAFANQNTVLDSFLDGLGNGIGYTLALMVMGLIREVIGTGTLSFGKIFTFIPEVTLPILKGDGYDFSLSLFANPAGGFIVFGIIMAIIAAVRYHKKDVESVKRRKAAFAAQAKAKENTLVKEGK